MTTKPLLWTQSSLATVTGGSISTPFKVTGVSIDSRTVQEGDLFVALKNDRDGHYFIRSALDKGAVAALVLWRPRGLPRDLPLVFVRNTQTALEDIGCAARARSCAQIIAVTGSVGKTTTKEALHHVLKEYGQSHASVSSYNNHWGVPLSLARMPYETEFGIFEAGMNHAGELRTLSRMIRPHIAVITTVASAHLAHFDSEETIAKAKSEIYDGIAVGGTVILPRDNEYFDLLNNTAQERQLNVVTFGIHPQAMVRWINADQPQETPHVHINDQFYAIKLGAFGDHMVLNALSVLAVVHSLGLDVHQAIQSLETFKAVKGRGDRHTLLMPQGQKMTVIDESYNANPCSMKAALRVLGQQKEGRRIAFLGDMLELGNQSRDLHADLLETLKENMPDHVILVGDHMQALADVLSPHLEGLVHYKTVGTLLDSLDALFEENDTVMIKGSNGMGIGRVVEKLLKMYTPASE